MTGLGKCYACGRTWNWFTLTREFGEPLALDDRYVEAPPIDFTVYEARVRSKLRRPVADGHHPELLRYATEERKITPETLNAWKVSSQGNNVFRWPIYAWAGNTWQIVNARMRSIERQDWFEIKGGCTDLMMGNHLIGQVPGYAGPWEGSDTFPETGIIIPDHCPKRAIITEGQWDAMTGYQLGIPNMLSLPNGANHLNCASMLRYIPEDWEIWLAVDMDEQGDRTTEAFFAQLGVDRIARIHMPHKDLNDWLRADPGLTADKIYSMAKGVSTMVALKEAAVKKLDSFINFMDTSEEEEEDRVVCDTPWELLTEMLDGGFRQKQTTGLLAPSGAGKTTCVDQIAIHCAAKCEEAVGIITLEGSRFKAKSRYRQQAKGYTNYPDEVLARIAKRLILSDLEGKAVMWQKTMEEFQAMIDQGVKLIIWDNPDYQMSTVMGNAERVKLQAYAAFQDLCMRNAVHGIVVWQPLKIDASQIINSGHQKGMAQALQDSDNYINLNRFGLLRRLEVEKTRECGVNPERNHVWLKYDQDTKCLHETRGQANVKIQDDEDIFKDF